MKRTISLALIFTLALTMITGCKNNSKSTSSKESIDETEVTTKVTTETNIESSIPTFNDDDIVFIVQEWNYAWGYNYELTIYTADGHSYYRDFSNAGRTDYTLDDAYSIPHTGGTQPFTPEEMMILIEFYYDIETFDQTIYNYAMDYGMKSVYFVEPATEDNEANFVHLGSFGDTCYMPNDTNALGICNRLGLNWE